ncbi:MAG: signal recognition particle protein [Kiritimatiellae bacterium]|nr:signal recognition particle protein [Kiritimatiellia bacterium]
MDTRAPMFEALTSSLQTVFRRLRGQGTLTEANIEEALREVRTALLEADVNYQVAQQFIDGVRKRCVGEEVLRGITPGQQVIRRIHEQLVELLGRARRDVRWGGRPMNVMLVGLNGSGKTTTAAKLAKRWSAERRKVLLVACDLKRPAAVEQLRILGSRVGVDVAGPEPGDTPSTLAQRAARKAQRELYDVAIYDTAGRLDVDDELLAELRELRGLIRPHNVILVLDAAVGQSAVRVAQRFHETVGLTGFILTKLDGDARGGAALSVHAVTGCPILMIGTGEKLDDLEPFHPDRMASRILGMGDVVTLVEKARQAVDEEAVKKLEEKLRGDGRLNLEDLLEQLRQMKRLGPLHQLLDLMPGAAQLPPHLREQALQQSPQQLKRTEAIILSMTPRERRNPEIIDGRRRRRIAAGSGTSVTEVNDLLQRFKMMREMMKRVRGGRLPFPPR